MQRIERNDPRLGWDGAIDVEHTPEWSQAWRLPLAERGLYYPGLQVRAAMAAGVRLRFRSDTRNLYLAFSPDREECKPLDVRCDDQLITTIPTQGQDEATVRDLPPGEKRLEIWLPHFGQFRLRELAIDEGASLAPHADARDKWITYGSSITHCRLANSPTQTWPAIVATRCGFNLTCLGYGGECHLDPLMARVIRDREASFISLKVGINMHGGSLSPRTFMPNLIGFVKIIREKHPHTPLAVISPICSPPREQTPGITGMTLRSQREDVRQAVELLRAHGDEHIHYIDGLSLFGPELVHLMPDELHPDNEGYARLAENFIRHVAEPIFRSHRPSSSA